MKNYKRYLPLVLVSILQILFGIVMISLSWQSNGIQSLLRLIGIAFIVSSCVPLFFLVTVRYHKQMRLFTSIISIILMIVGFICAIVQAIQNSDLSFPSPIFIIFVVVGYEMFFVFSLKLKQEDK